MTKVTFEWDDLEDISEVPLLYEFAFLPYDSMPEGEYTYELVSVVDEEEHLLESGLLIYGNYERETHQYEPEPESKNTFIQYEG